MKNEKMKLWYSIVILLVCFVACKNSSLKQREIMSSSVQDTLKEPRYDSIVSFDDGYQGGKKGKKYYLYKDSFFCVERIRSIVGNIILISFLEGRQSVELSMRKVQNRRKWSLLWSIGITIMER